jgi:hypothetical protein
VAALFANRNRLILLPHTEDFRLFQVSSEELPEFLRSMFQQSDRRALRCASLTSIPAPQEEEAPE